MFILLLVIIYISFVSIGLPNAVPGAAWPVMQLYFDVPVYFAGILAIIISAGTIIACLLTERLTKFFSAWLLTATGIFIIAVSLLGFSFSGSFLLLCIWATPFGFGVGVIDTVINNYVAIHYTSKHMSWLHSFWGVGAMAGPYIIGFYLTRGFEWNYGYRAIAAVQFVFVVMLLLSFSLWKKRDRQAVSSPSPEVKGIFEILKIKGVKYVLIGFFAYCAVEATVGLWASTFLVTARGISVESAALFASFFFIGITVGRFISGFVSEKLGDKKMILLGLVIVFVGLVAVWLPVNTDIICLIGLIIIGLGCAPVFPGIIHSTPENFGTQNSQAIIGIQIASSYAGATIMPFLFGLLVNIVGIHIFPVFLLIFLVLTIVMMILLNKSVRKQKCLL